VNAIMNPWVPFNVLRFLSACKVLVPQVVLSAIELTSYLDLYMEQYTN
jgi:hypothetical protein